MRTKVDNELIIETQLNAPILHTFQKEFQIMR